MKRKNKIKNQYKVFAVVSFIILSIYAISILASLFWAVLASFKSRFDFRLNLFGLPKEWIWENFYGAFTKLTLQIQADGGYKYIGFMEQLSNTIIICAVLTFVEIFSRLVPAYVCAKYNCAVTRLLFNINIFMMIIPIMGALGTTMIFIRALNLYDTILCLVILRSGFGGSNFLIFYATYKSVSWEYAEAAQLDGAGHFTIFFKIMIPMGMGTIMALTIMSVIGLWSAYDFNIVYIPSMPVLAYGLFKYQSTPASGVTIPIQLAGAIVTSIPSIVLFAAFRKKIMTNISIGGLKG